MSSFSNDSLFDQKTYSTSEEKKRAYLISTYHNNNHEASAQENLAELERLADTYGLETIGKSCLLLREISSSTYLSKGKLEEVSLDILDLQPDVVIFDEEIHPGQQRNLEKHFNKPVIDRAEVILGVFAQRAQTKEAQLQIELAQLEYQAPRLKKLWTHLSRQSGGGSGGGYNKGEGEKQIEIDRRLIKKKAQLIREELEKVRLQRMTQRKARLRQDLPIFSIIGYTNAGKSTLLKALTDADVLVEDKLFATLDTTTRRFELPTQHEILLVDTVGFIRKLPHLLVNAFRSTLEESLYADYLLHLVDASHPYAKRQMDATLDVLKELGIKDKPILTLLNKTDRCTDMAHLTLLENAAKEATGIDPIRISATEKIGFDTLLETLSVAIAKRRQLCSLRVPQSSYHHIAPLLGEWEIINQDYQDEFILIEARVPPQHIQNISKWKIISDKT